MAGIAAAVRKAIGSLDLAPTDQGTAQLAVTYAKAIDDGGDLDRLGPQLLAVLESLLLSPRARAAVVKGGKTDVPTGSPLDELRQRRAARANRAATVDAAAP